MAKFDFRVSLLACTLLLVVSCGTSRNLASGTLSETALTNQIWTYSQSHPEGFTLYISTMTEPTEGVSVAYEATQNSHSKKALKKVVSHSLSHNGYVGGWKESDTGLYYFDSVRLFPEDSLQAAINFALENRQLAIYVISTGEEIDLTGMQP